MCFDCCQRYQSLALDKLGKIFEYWGRLVAKCHILVFLAFTTFFVYLGY